MKASANESGGVKNTRALLLYGMSFALLWLLLTKGDISSWIIGIIAVPLAVWCRLSLFPAPRPAASPGISFTGLMTFLPFFLWQSLKGGWSSALLAIHPRKQVKPSFVHYFIQLPEGRPQLYFLHVVSLLPGTLSVGIDGNQLLVHVLDSDSDYRRELQYCQQRIRSLFALAAD